MQVSKGKPASRGRRPPSRGHHKKVISKEMECISTSFEENSESEEGDPKGRVLKTMGGPAVVVGFDPSKFTCTTF